MVQQSQVDADQFVPVQHGEDCSEAQKCTERQFVFTILARKAHQRDADDGSQYRADEDCEKRESRSDERSDHGHHFHVAKSHSFDPTEAEVRFAYEPQQSATDRGADQARHDGNQARPRVRHTQALKEACDKRARQPHKDADCEANPQAIERDHVGKDSVIGIDEGKNDQSGTKEKIHKPLNAEAKLEINQATHDASKDLDKGIADGDRLLALPAAPTKEQIAQNGNVVSIGNRGLALRAP